MNIFLGYPPENIKQWIKDHYNTGPDLSIPLCFTAVDAGATIALKCIGNSMNTATFQTSTDGNTWTDYTQSTSITLANSGDKVYFKATVDNTSIVRNTSNRLQFTTTQSAKKVNVSGNVMSLLSPEFSQMRSVGSYCFYGLFISCKNIADCNGLTLPATTLADKCYSGMFSECSNLTEAPELPATTLADYCYNNMFFGCTSLTQAPELPATTLADTCYAYMFNGCTSLVQAPELPVTTLADNCYGGMFSECSNLTEAPELPATTLADKCYNNMFYGCSSLTEAPSIKTYTSDLCAFYGMLDEFDWEAQTWGQLTSCNWTDLSLYEAEAMVLSEQIFGSGDSSVDIRISITCGDGNATVYFDPENWTWVFEY